MLHQLGIPFEVVPGNVQEIHEETGDAPRLAELNAVAKSNQVAQGRPNSLVLGADTLVYLGREVFGKPRDAVDAEGMLLRLSGRTHRVVTGICLTHAAKRKQRSFVETTDVTFRTLSLVEVRTYLSSIHPFDKAGAYAIQENGDAIVASVVGSHSNVVGLPLERLQTELQQWADFS